MPPMTFDRSAVTTGAAPVVLADADADDDAAAEADDVPEVLLSPLHVSAFDDHDKVTPVALVQALPIVSFEPLTKLTGAH